MAEQRMVLANKEVAGVVADMMGFVISLPSRGVMAVWHTVMDIISTERDTSVAIYKIVKTCLESVVITNIQLWWKGEISGKRCVENIIECGVVVASGFGGGIAGKMFGGAVFGSVFGPVGATCGAIIGAITGGVLGAAWAAETLSDRLNQWVFGLSKSEALENAFRFLSLSRNASNGEINTQYRRLALQFHPDKGGDKEKWTRLQYSMEVIRASKEEGQCRLM